MTGKARIDKASSAGRGGGRGDGRVPDRRPERRSSAEIESRLREAADVLRRLPRPKEIAELRGRWSAWPGVVRKAGEAYGYDRTRRIVIPPSGAEIDRMDEAVVWLQWLDKKESHLVWLRVSGVAWRDLEHVFGHSARTLQRRHQSALDRISWRLLDPIA